MQGSALAIDGETKKADLTLRTLLSREKDVKTQIMINNNLGINSWLNAQDTQTSEQRFLKCLELSGLTTDQTEFQDYDTSTALFLANYSSLLVTQTSRDTKNVSEILKLALRYFEGACD